MALMVLINHHGTMCGLFKASFPRVPPSAPTHTFWDTPSPGLPESQQRRPTAFLEGRSLLLGGASLKLGDSQPPPECVVSEVPPPLGQASMAQHAAVEQAFIRCNAGLGGRRGGPKTNKGSRTLVNGWGGAMWATHVGPPHPPQGSLPCVGGSRTGRVEQP